MPVRIQIEEVQDSVVLVAGDGHGRSRAAIGEAAEAGAYKKTRLGGRVGVEGPRHPHIGGRRGRRSLGVLEILERCMPTASRLSVTILQLKGLGDKIAHGRREAAGDRQQWKPSPPEG